MDQAHDTQSQQLFGWTIQSCLENSQGPLADADLDLVYCGAAVGAGDCLSHVRQTTLAWQTKAINFVENELYVLSGDQRPVILMRAKAPTEAQKRDAGLLMPSSYSQARDLLGRAIGEAKKLKASRINLRFVDATEREVLGALVGLELATYNYKQAVAKAGINLPLIGLDVKDEWIKAAASLGTATNIARHLVNTPPNLLYPESFAAAVQKIFASQASLSFDLWNEERLRQEGMGLLLAVGGGSEHRPCMLHIRYRPSGSAAQSPIALVGKGVTFDCGGLDIKDAAGMRLMKKDMGGAAALVGALYWLTRTNAGRPVDIFLPLAENAISGQAYRPSDIIQAKNGINVEIHNTDAEGRLVLADAMAVAAAQSGVDKPAAIMVVATLTGAIKVGLGSDVAGFFANDEALAQGISSSSQEWGDLMWRMPLFDGYRSRLDTNVADINHCSTGSFGGAITAALFLAEFAKGYPFSHMDIYAWAEGERGAIREVGGSGQAVQCLAGFLQKFGQ